MANYPNKLNWASISCGCLLLSAVAVSTVTMAQDDSASVAAMKAASNYSSWQLSEPTGRLIVKYRSPVQPAQSPRGSKRFIRGALREQLQLALDRKLSDTQELLVGTGGTVQQLEAQARVLSNDSNIEYASLEYRRYPLLQPNDPLYQGSNSIGNQSYLYNGEYSVHAPGGWDITTGSDSSVIAIVDTGVLPDHPDIINRSVDSLGYDFVSADNPNDFSSANDGDGRDTNPVDPGDPCNGGSSSWHGTSVASAAAGTSNNGEGITGIDWNARLLHARALGICGGTDADIIDAIRWSAGLPVAGIPDNPTPANVVNLSLGGATECTRAWQDVIDELTAKNIVFVMAAGNETRNALRSSPANCANVITVGSSTPGGDVDSGFSNFGLKVTISTSGRNILVASNRGFNTMDPNGDFYRAETGTSFSAAIVSGAISLMHSLNPDLGPGAVRALLQESATPYASGSSCDLYHCGGGVLNLARALSNLRDNNYNPDRDVATDLIQNQSVLLPLQQNTDGALFGFKDIRYYAVVVPERGLLAAESTGTEDLYAYMLNADLSVIALDDDSGDSTNFRVASLVDPGTYYIAVEREAHRSTDGEVPFTLLATLSDDAPLPFTFNSVADATASAVVESNTVTISGLEDESVLTVSDGFYSLNGGDFLNNPTTVRNGDTLLIATQSPGNPRSSSVTTVTVGAYTTSFTVTTSATGVAPISARLRNSSGCSVVSTGQFDPVFFLVLILAAGAMLRRNRKEFW